MTDHTYAGHTLPEIKAAAEATNDIIRSHGWNGTVEMGDHMGNDESFMKLASPVTMLALAARIEELESAWHVETLERKDAIIAKQESHNDELKARITDLEHERDAAVEARREAQMETQLARGARNRSGVEAGKEMRKQVKAARLEGWQAAREMAANLCHEQWKAHSHEERVDACDDCAGSIRAMQPPAEWRSAEVTPVFGAATNTPESLCKICARANVSCPVYPLETQHCVEYFAVPNPYPLSPDEVAIAVGNLKSHAQPTWPHPDGFAGGLTERES